MTTKVTSREYLWLTVYSTLHDLHLYLSVVFLVVRSVAKYLGNPGRYSEASGFVARGGIGIVASNATDSVLRLRQISLGIAVRKGVSHFLACLSFARARNVSTKLCIVIRMGKTFPKNNRSFYPYTVEGKITRFVFPVYVGG